MEFQEICQFHENEYNLGFCLNKQCSQNPEYCYDCKTERHGDHVKDCFSFNNSLKILSDEFYTLKEQRDYIKDKLYEMTRDFQVFLENNFQKRLDQLYEIYTFFENKDYNLAKQNLNKFPKLQISSQKEQIRQELEQIMNKCLEFQQYFKQVNIYKFEQKISEYIICSDIVNIQQNQNESEIVNIQQNQNESEFVIIQQNQNESEFVNIQQNQNESEFVNIQQNQNESEFFQIYQLCEILLNEAKTLKAQGNFQQCLKKLDEVISLDKDNDDAHLEAAQILFDLGQNSKALESVQKCINSNSKNGKGYLIKGEILQTMQNYSQAVIAYEMAEKFTYNISFDLYYQLANTYNSCKNYQKAVIYFDKAILFEPECASSYNNKATALKCLNQYDDALICYDKAIENQPGNDRFLINKGVFLYEINKFNEALVEFEKAQQINQQNPRLYLNKGQLLQRMNRFNEALECYNKLIQYDSYYYNGQLYKNQLLAIMAQNQIVNHS